uniref:Uncharacterized protein n=1 Tax=Lutzomyia longipalpis TaxID=7200 RepID=A0A1B0GJA2_LUTLO
MAQLISNMNQHIEEQRAQRQGESTRLAEILESQRDCFQSFIEQSRIFPCHTLAIRKPHVATFFWPTCRRHILIIPCVTPRYARFRATLRTDQVWAYIDHSLCNPQVPHGSGQLYGRTRYLTPTFFWTIDPYGADSSSNSDYVHPQTNTTSISRQAQ